ncbi:MAG: hypothetical protein JWQ37_1287 [Blastococcus sp.]|nr:hypothetical protein [Blastococcus sp.]
MCAFCGESVEKAEPDPCALILLTNWRSLSQDQAEQQFFTHAACLLSRMYSEVVAEAGVLHQRNELRP